MGKRPPDSDPIQQFDTKAAIESAKFVANSADNITAGIASIEAQLQQLPGKVAAEVLLSNSESLHFCRHNDVWRLVYVYEDGSANRAMLMRECSLDIRARCAEALPELVLNILSDYRRRHDLTSKALVGISRASQLLGQKEGA